MRLNARKGFLYLILSGAALAALSGCVTKGQIQTIVADSNVAALTAQLEDDADAIEKILAFIEQNPELTEVNQRLLIRLAALYATAKKPNLALSALDEANDMGNLSRLGDRDRMLVSLRGPLVWALSVTEGRLTNAQGKAAEGHLASIRAYHDAQTGLSPQLRAFLYSAEIQALLAHRGTFAINAARSDVLALRQSMETSLNRYTTFWGRTERLGQINTLRNARATSCSGAISFSEEVDVLPDISLLRYSGVVYCEIEKVLESYEQFLKQYRFPATATPTAELSDAALRAKLPLPDWVTCKTVSSSVARNVDVSCEPS